MEEINEIQSNIEVVQEKGEGLSNPGDSTSQEAMHATVRELFDKAQRLEDEAKAKLKSLEVRTKSFTRDLVQNFVPYISLCEKLPLCPGGPVRYDIVHMLDQKNA